MNYFLNKALFYRRLLAMSGEKLETLEELEKSIKIGRLPVVPEELIGLLILPQKWIRKLELQNLLKIFFVSMWKIICILEVQLKQSHVSNMKIWCIYWGRVIWGMHTPDLNSAFRVYLKLDEQAKGSN